MELRNGGLGKFCLFQDIEDILIFLLEVLLYYISYFCMIDFCVWCEEGI